MAQAAARFSSVDCGLHRSEPGPANVRGRATPGGSRHRLAHWPVAVNLTSAVLHRRTLVSLGGDVSAVAWAPYPDARLFGVVCIRLRRRGVLPQLACRSTAHRPQLPAFS